MAMTGDEEGKQMFITAEETKDNSPLQTMLEVYWLIKKTNEFLKELEESSHNNVQEAATGDN